MDKQFGNGFDELLSMVDESNSYDRDLIIKAYKKAEALHAGQTRFSGEPYIIHPIEVAKILVSLGLDTQSIVAALLHDVIEDTDETKEDVEKEFGKDVAFLVEGVTKLGKVDIKSKVEQQAENIRKMLLAMAEDVRVIIIKLADRLHNMRTLDFMYEAKRREKALETLEIFAPIAHRLGIRALKEELEDLAIRHLDPVGYEEIKNRLSQNSVVSKDLIPSIIRKISERLKETVENPHIDGRIKSVTGIYRKMYMQNRSFDEIYDIYAVRIIVDSVNDCYNCLGVIHDMFRPIPGRFKDYIATPKPNMYQSLHSTVIGKEGIPFEVQIRTWEMHRTAEYGIAAHWKYKSGVKGKDDKFDEKIAWIHQMVDKQNEQTDGETPEEFLYTVKNDLEFEEVFVFTPQGDVKTLPKNSTIIDFAYAIHTQVGHKMTGAKVNGRMVPLDYILHTGEICDIITTKQEDKGPSRDWLNIVRTSEARNKIRSWFKKEKREENIVAGKSELEKEFKRNYIRLSDDKYDEFINRLVARQKCNTADELYAKIGYGGISVSRIMPSIKDLYKQFVLEDSDALPPKPAMPQPNRHSLSNKDGIIVEGFDDCQIKLSKCCNPLPGDRIIGFITRGHGVSIHKRDCMNVPRDIAESEEPGRWLNAYWDDDIKFNLNTTLSIFCIDRENLLADIMKACYEIKINISNIEARVLKNGNSIITLGIVVDNTEHLNNFLARLKKVDNIISVERASM